MGKITVEIEIKTFGTMGHPSKLIGINYAFETDIFKEFEQLANFIIIFFIYPD